MNKWIEKIEWLIVIIVAIMAFSVPITEYDDAPDKMAVKIGLGKNIAPTNAIPVVNVEGMNITGELTPVYDPLVIELEAVEAYFSIKDNRRNKSILIISRGIDPLRNKTYEFRKNLNALDYNDDLPYYYQNTDYEIGPFEKQNITVIFFKSNAFLVFIISLFYGVVIGIMAILIIIAIESILKKIIKLVKTG